MASESYLLSLCGPQQYPHIYFLKAQSLLVSPAPWYYISIVPLGRF
jgi:hypothetical protein